MLVNINSEYVFDTDYLPVMSIGGGGEMSLWFSNDRMNISVDEVANRRKVIDIIAEHRSIGTKYLKIVSHVDSEIVDIEVK